MQKGKWQKPAVRLSLQLPPDETEPPIWAPVDLSAEKESRDVSPLEGRAKLMARDLFAGFWQKDREQGFLKSATSARNGF